MKTLLLKNEMKQYGDTMESLAKVLNIHPHTLYMKMKEDGERTQQFNQGEIKVISERYKLTPEKIAEIFFS